MSQPLWMSIEPSLTETRLMLCVQDAGPVLKARLCAMPQHPRALGMLFEALSAWYRRPLRAVIDADAPGVRHRPEHWTQFLGELPGFDTQVEWIGRLDRTRDRFLGEMGDFGSAKRLVTKAATGLR
jgi:hypothetical protein